MGGTVAERDHAERDHAERDDADRSLRVVVHDRLPLFCLGMLRLLSELPMRVTAESETKEALFLQRCEQDPPDVVIVGLPADGDVASLTGRLRGWGVERIIVLYPGRLTDHAVRLAGAEIDTLLPFTVDAAALLAALTGQPAGADDRPPQDRRARPARPLSDLEHHVLERASAGETAAGVSRELGVHPNSVQAAVRGVLRSTGSKSMDEAVALARRIRLTSSP